jgi:hypothetical protein
MKIFGKSKHEDGGHAAAVREFMKLKDGEPLPREGSCAFFYNTFTYAGETVPLGSKGGYVFFHIENDDVIQEILSGVPSVQVTDDDGRILVSILFRTGTIINWIQLFIDAANPNSYEILSSIIKKKEIVLALLNMVYGAIARERMLTIPIPKDVIDAIKKAAG